MIKVSIILPVFNAEKYIKTTVQSVLNQTLKDIELIIVDDGSTDNSFQICQKMQQLDDRIILKKIENKGVSNARNYGIELARGKYLMFIDADDEYNNKIVEKMTRSIEDADLSVCNFMYLKNNGKIFFKDIKNKCNFDETSKMICFLQRNNLFNVVWNKIYKREVIINNDIKFNLEISIAEDLEFNLKYIENIKKINFINELLYIYRVSETGLNYRYQKDRIHIRKKIYDYQKKIFKSKHYDINLLNNEYIKICLSELKQISYIKDENQKKGQIKSIIKDNNRKNELQRIQKEGNLKQKIISIFLNKQICLFIIYWIIEYFCKRGGKQ